MVRALVGLVVVLELAACGDDDRAVSTSHADAPIVADTPTVVTPAPTSGPSASPTTAAPSGGPPSALAIATVVCDDQPKRMGADAEVLTAESWQCTSGGEQARIDLYESDDQMAEAQQTITDFYKSSGDKRSLDQLPLVCGAWFSVGLDSNEQRDAVIDHLQAAEITASKCS
jgi:hypothetical protein